VASEHIARNPYLAFRVSISTTLIGIDGGINTAGQVQTG
jgi:hypothetical protein